MNDIIDAVNRLRAAFEAHGLSEPAIALGADDDLPKLHVLMARHGATFPMAGQGETKIRDMAILPPGWIYKPLP
jgi:hypothetical protein